ncbi:hypothetical protein ACFJIW_09630 [Tahibacter sp. UC22_41]|uniref:hypothetical protein n=1 Tax=Tahibacter sp. UC22_41 TaxID=3350178 RepID=UPI0036DDD453
MSMSDASLDSARLRTKQNLSPISQADCRGDVSIAYGIIADRRIADRRVAARCAQPSFVISHANPTT